MPTDKQTEKAILTKAVALVGPILEEFAKAKSDTYAIEARAVDDARVFKLSFSGKSPVEICVHIEASAHWGGMMNITCSPSTSLNGSVINFEILTMSLGVKHSTCDSGRLIQLLVQAHVSGLNFWRDLRREV